MDLIPNNGGYRRLKSFQLAQLVYDATERFCRRFIPKMSRTNDQMVQAARSGVQNIAEGSKASGTSKKTEIKLTNVARASLEELLLDYEDFLRQRNLSLWGRHDPKRQEFVNLRCSKVDHIALWAKQAAGKYQLAIEETAANALIALIHATCFLLDRQLKAQGKAFLQEGGFTERLYHMRKTFR